MNAMKAKSAVLIWLGILACFLLAPLVINETFISLVTKGLIWALFAMSFNVAFGYGGMLSFGHAAFFGVGAYTVAILVKNYEVWYGWAIIFGLFNGGILGFIYGVLTRRVSGFGFAILTLALAELVWVIIFRWYSLTSGDDGIWGIERTDIIESNLGYYYFVLVIVGAAVSYILFLPKTSFGKILMATRDNHKRVESLGVTLSLIRTQALILSATFSGLAGGLYALYTRGVSPELASWITSADVVVMTLLGGIEAALGPFAGAIILIGLEDYFSRIFDYWYLMVGMILVVVVLLLPRGLLSLGEKFNFIGRK